MKQTDLQSFYQMAVGLQDIRKIALHASNAEVMLGLFLPEKRLRAFLEETGYYGDPKDRVSLPDSQQAAKKLLDIVLRVNKRGYADIASTAPIMTSDDFALLRSYLETFEAEFARECRRLNVFIVTRKSIYDLRELIENPEHKFPESVTAVLPQQTIVDLRQAGRALAFDLPTACAFHICRATESLMITYCGVLMKKPWPHRQRDWGKYITELESHSAPKQITSRLREIKDLDRNPYLHPQKTATLEEAPILFEMCTGVMYFMAKEIETLQTSSSAKP